MPRTADQLEAIREESRERILQAALGLFSRQGYAGTSIRDIARAAKLSQGLMYNYYAGKEELLQAIIARGMAEARAALPQPVEGAGAGDRLERLIRGSLAVVGRNVDFWRLSYSLRMQPSLLGEGAAEIRAWSDSLRRDLEGAFTAAGIPDPEVEAAVLFALIDGVAQHQAMAPRRYPIGAVADAIVKRYRGLCS